MFPNNLAPQNQNTVPIEPAKALRTLQIIRVAIVMGPLFFMAVALFLAEGSLNFEFDMMEIVALVFSLNAVVIFFMADKLFMMRPVANYSSMTVEEKQSVILGKISTTEIIKGAILEGATFFSLILILIEQSGVGLILGLLLIGLSVATFPTSSRFQFKMENLKSQLG